MKNITIFFIGLILLIYKFNFSYSQNDSIYLELFSLKNIHSIFLSCDPHEDTTFTGIDTIYSQIDDEIITVLIEYKSGKKIKSTGWYNNRQKYRETNYNGFVKHGFDTRWYKNGQKEFQTYYENGKTIIPLITWYENGSLQGINDIDDSTNKGFIKEFYKNGKLKKESYAVDTTEYGCIEKVYYENGTIHSESAFNLGIQKWTVYHENGQKAFEGNVYNIPLAKLGHWQEWHDNGQLRQECFFNDSIPNLRIGTWSWWDKEGNLIKQEIYKNNELIKEKNFLPIPDGRDQ